jgi:hypothetical protein
MQMKQFIETTATRSSNNKNPSNVVWKRLKKVRAILRRTRSRVRSAWNAGGVIEQRAKQMKEEREQRVLRSNGRFYF